MSKVVLYIAATLDGFIARTDGSFDFLEPYDHKGTDYGYHEFYSQVDTILMGADTYRQLLSFDKWLYQGKDTFVFSSTAPDIIPGVEIWDGTPKALMERLGDRKVIWLVGGGKLIASFLNDDLVDSAVVTLIPVLLGKGIPLFHRLNRDIGVHHLTTKWYDEVLQLHFSFRE